MDAGARDTFLTRIQNGGLISGNCIDSLDESLSVDEQICCNCSPVLGMCMVISHRTSDVCRTERERSLRMMHTGLIWSLHTLSPWTPRGLNDCAVSARPAPTWPLVADHRQLKGSPSVPDQSKRRRRMEVIRSSDGATAGSGLSPSLAHSSLPW